MPQEIRPKSMKGHTVTRVKGNLSVVCWKDKRDVYVLTNMHSPSVDCNFRDESGNAIKPRVIKDYNAHKDFVDKSDRMETAMEFLRGHGNGQRNCFSTF
jgi:hypothetical protein